MSAIIFIMLFELSQVIYVKKHPKKQLIEWNWEKCEFGYGTKCLI